MKETNFAEDCVTFLDFGNGKVVKEAMCSDEMFGFLSSDVRGNVDQFLLDNRGPILQLMREMGDGEISSDMLHVMVYNRQYRDIISRYMERDMDDAMAKWELVSVVLGIRMDLAVEAYRVQSGYFIGVKKREIPGHMGYPDVAFLFRNMSNGLGVSRVGNHLITAWDYVSFEPVVFRI